jgi:hypothetical protein
MKIEILGTSCPKRKATEKISSINSCGKGDPFE